MECRLCFAETRLFGRTVVLGKHEASFRRCSGCGFVFVEDPYWLDEAYRLDITGTDLGLVQRNIFFSNVTLLLLGTLFKLQGKYLDYGGGTGMFTRLMRDAGYQFYCFDNGGSNIFSKDFTAKLGGADQYELVTASEVFEHIVDPLETAARIRLNTSNIFIMTHLLPSEPPPLDSWWYYGLEHGQHVSFYTIKSLEVLADKLNLKLSSDGKCLHLLSVRKIPTWLFSIITHPVVCSIYSQFYRRGSLLEADFRSLREHTKKYDAHSN